jgi:hypothetical protein
MPNPAVLRNAMLVAAYRQTHGTPDTMVDMKYLLPRLGLTSGQREEVARQIAGRGWAAFDQSIHGQYLALTMRGIEVAEDLERPLLRRWPSDHPVLLSFVASIIGGVVALFLGRALDRIMPPHGVSASTPATEP